MAEVDLWLRSTYHWGWLMTEVDLWLRLTYDWGWLMTDVDLWLRSTFGWGRLMTEADLWLRSTYDWGQLMAEVDLWLMSTYGWGSTLNLFSNKVRHKHVTTLTTLTQTPLWMITIGSCILFQHIHSHYGDLWKVCGNIHCSINCLSHVNVW